MCSGKGDSSCSTGAENSASPSPTPNPPHPTPPHLIHQPTPKTLQRVFGTWGFEVTTSQAGVRRTVGPVAGRNYEFWLAGQDSSQLVVIEEAVLPSLEGGGGAASGGGGSRKRRMQLLDVGADCRGGKWGAELPPRLLEMHSHWLDRWGHA